MAFLVLRFERRLAPASWSAPRSSSHAFHHERVCGSRLFSRQVFENAIVECAPSATDALHHVPGRARLMAAQRIDTQCSVVHTATEPSIARARAVTALRMPLRARGSRSSWCLRRPPLDRSRTCELALPRAPHPADPMCIVAPAPAALQSSQHVRREAPNAASPLSN